MKKKVFGRKLSRERDTRRALFRSLTRSLILNRKLTTTKAKAKAVLPFVEKVVRVCLGANTPSVKRRVYSLLANDKKLVDQFLPRLNLEFPREKRIVGMIPLPSRKGDSSEMVRLSLVEELFAPVVESKKKGTKEEKTLKKKKT